jgi:hypothetical protein
MSPILCCSKRAIAAAHQKQRLRQLRQQQQQQQVTFQYTTATSCTTLAVQARCRQSARLQLEMKAVV